MAVGGFVEPEHPRARPGTAELRAAERAATDLRMLHRVTTALAAALDEHEVAKVVVCQGRDALGASGGTLALVRGDRLELVGHHGYEPEIVAPFEQIPLDADLPLAEAARTGHAVEIGSRAERDGRYPQLRPVPHASQGLLAVPIGPPGAVVGVIGFSFDGPLDLSTADRDLLTSLAGQCAQALERARLLDAERTAREQAEVAARRLEQLQRTTGALSSARTVREVAQAVLRHGIASPGAASGGLWVVDDEGTAARMIDTIGMHPEVPGRFAVIPLDSDLPLADAIRRRAPIYVGSRAERDARWPALAGTPTDVEAIAMLPLTSRDRVIGCLVFGFVPARSFDDGKRRFLEAIAQQCAQALERARLYDAERIAVERLRFLARAGELLASTLDYERTLAQVTELGLGVLGELCVLDVVEDGVVKRVGVAHLDPDKRKLLDRLRDNRMQPDSIAATVLASGRPVRLDEVTEQAIRAATDSEEHFRMALALAPGPTMIVPLVAGGRSIGLLYFSAPRGARSYTDDDLALAEELAGRAAVAVDNARLFAQRTGVAQILQRSLLPPRLPDVPGVELAAAFRPYAEGLDVGGDFYDVFPVGDEWAVAIGDVVGTGPAAAATTALVRHTARAVAPHVADPARVAAAVNDALAVADEDAFCTLVFGLLRREAAGVRLRLVCAGHPAPFVVRAGGQVEPVDACGALLGPFPVVDAEAVEVVLLPGDALVTYTDGVIEARRAGAVRGAGPDSFYGDARLEATLAGPFRSAAELAERIDRDVLDFSGGHAADDVAVLVVRAL